MASDLDPDLELVRKLHLELNGSGRRTRGAVPKPTKRLKRETSRTLSESNREEPTASRSGSGSGSGSARVVRREGILKRLVKKQPETDSNNQLGPEAEAGAPDHGLAGELPALEPQASTRADAKVKSRSQPGADAGSWHSADSIGHVKTASATENAANLARAAGLRDVGDMEPRVKCFYQGCLYGLSLESRVMASRTALAEALRLALAPDESITANELQIVVLDSEGNQSQCFSSDTDSCWQAAVTAAKRVYITASSLATQ